MHKAVLDPCCGSRMFWFDPLRQDVLFGDIRSERQNLCDGRLLEVLPDMHMDFRSLPFGDESFQVVVFDPPTLFTPGLKAGLLPSTASWAATGAKTCAKVFRSVSGF